MNPDFPVLLVETPSRRGPAETGLEELRAALGRAGVSTQMRPAGDDMTAFAQQSNRVSAFIYAVACDPADASADDRALAVLTRFVAAVRGRNPAVPIYLFGERLSAVALPPPVLKEIHGFVNAFEDSADFVARGIARTAQDYLDALAPPFFKALTDYARRGAYSWHAPGHSGGTAFLKSPVGTMFHEFFGENMLRADVCNAVEELGQLLDHTGPVADAERNAARIFSADHMYFVTNGTSTSNKIVWSAMVSPGDIVVVDRNCHKSVLHALILTGAIPIFLTPTRNQIGIIGPIPRREFDPASIRAKIEANPFVRDKTATPRLLTLTQSTYDGIVYNVEAIKASLDGYVGTLHFDEAWLPHAAFHDFYHQMLPADAWAQLTRGHVDRVPVDELKDRTTAVLLTPYPPGIPLLIPGERFNEAIVSYLRIAEAFNQAYPGLETNIHGAETRTAGDRSRLYVNCLREERP